MDNENENGGITHRHSNEQNGTEGWGARDSLRRNFRRVTKTQDEVTPLLGSGSGSSSEDGGNREAEWEGYADYVGLSFWKKPTVSLCTRYYIPQVKADHNRYIGYCPHSSSLRSQWAGYWSRS